MRTCLLMALLMGAGSAAAQPAVRDTTVHLPAQGDIAKPDVRADVLALRLTMPQAVVSAGATYAAARLRLRWTGGAGAVRLRAELPPDLRALFTSPPSSQPR